MAARSVWKRLHPILDGLDPREGLHLHAERGAKRDPRLITLQQGVQQPHQDAQELPDPTARSKSDEIVMGYEYGRLASYGPVIDPAEEVDKACVRPPTARCASAGFIKSDAIDPAYFSGRNQLPRTRWPGGPKALRAACNKVLLEEDRVAFCAGS